MKHKKIVISLTVSLMLGFLSAAGATDSGLIPVMGPNTQAALAAGNVKTANVSTGRPAMKQGEILVQFKNTLSTTSASDLAYSLGGSVMKTVGKDQISLVSLPKNISVAQAVDNFLSDPNVVHAQPNYRYYATAAPNDASYTQLWGLNNTGQTITNPSYNPPGTINPNNPGTIGSDIDAHLAWDVITDCSAVIVAVIDTAINYTHEDLRDNMWTGNANGGWDFVDNDNDPMATDGQIHGGHVAGTIGARGNNTVGTTGVCQRVQIMAVRVLGPGGGFTSDIIQGIEFAADNNADVINMSLGGRGGFDQLYSDAITYARNADVVVVVAAGNETNNNDGGALANNRWPCNFTQDNLICVAALDQAYALADFSNTGATSVDVGAPGTNVLSTWAGSLIEERLFTGWTQSSVGSIWEFGTCGGAYGVPILYNPGASGWCNNTGYLNNTDSTSWGTYDLSGGLLGAGLSYLADSSVATGDFFSTYASSAGGNPNGTIPLQSSDVSTGGFKSFDHSLFGCRSATCSIGFRLTSNASGVSIGPGVALIDIQTVETGSTVYQNIDGTSMASPHVAGIAALVRAYNPQYTYLDTVNAILGGGQATPALATTTTTGMAANAMGSLAFINAPTGVSATP